MSYTVGNEQSFTGFGVDDDLDATLKSKLGEGLARAAKGIDTKNLPAVLKQAEDLGKKYFGVGADDAKNKAFQFLYLQATSAMSSVMQTGAIKTAKIMVNSGITIGSEANSLYTKLKSDEPIDASGMMDMAGAGQKVIQSLLNVGKQLGLVNNTQIKEVMEWTNVAAGCAASAGTLPPPAAAAACALQFFGKLIPALNKTDAGPPVSSPRAIFVPNGGNKLILAASDAERLARVLRYKYGVTSYEQLYTRCFKKHTDTIDFADGTVSESSFFNTEKYPSMDSNKPKTAVDMRVALVLMRFQGADSPGKETGVLSVGPLHSSTVPSLPVHGSGVNPWLATRHVLSRIARSEAAGTAGRDHTSRSISSQYIYDHDVNVPVIDVGAQWWRTYKDQRNSFGLDAFKRVHELINFFTAITQREFELGQRSIMQYVTPYDMPVRIYGVNDTGGGGCRDNFYEVEDPPCVPYGVKCLTSLDRCYLGVNRCNEWPDQLLPGHAQYGCAIRMLGSLRMMAAFSYMHMVYMMSYEGGVASESRDMIANLPPSNDPAISLQLTVDVNQPNADGARWPRPLNHILNSIRIKAQQVETIKKLAVGQAKKDQEILHLDPNIIAKFQAATKTVSGKSEQQLDIASLVASGQIKTQVQDHIDCLRSGGAWYTGGAACDTDARGNLINCRAPTSSTIKKYYCVPKTTPGAQTIKPTGEVSSQISQIGAGTLLAVAGAGLLLMKLLNK